MVSNGFLPGWADANETWPAVCQSCVITTLVNPLASRLMTGTTGSPSFTARLPPGRKQFWTSMTSSAEASSILIEGAAQTGREAAAVKARLPNPVSVVLRSIMPISLSLGSRLANRVGGGRSKKRQLVVRSWSDSKSASLARLNPVADRAETRKGLLPLIARRAADDPKGTLAAKAQPLHQRDRRVVPSAGGIDPRLIPGHAVDTDRLRHRDPPGVHPGNGARGLLGETGAIVRLCGR